MDEIALSITIIIINWIISSHHDRVPGRSDGAASFPLAAAPRVTSLVGKWHHHQSCRLLPSHIYITYLYYGSFPLFNQLIIELQILSSEIFYQIAIPWILFSRHQVHTIDLNRNHELRRPLQRRTALSLRGWWPAKCSSVGDQWETALQGRPASQPPAQRLQ